MVEEGGDRRRDDVPLSFTHLGRTKQPMGRQWLTRCMAWLRGRLERGSARDLSSLVGPDDRWVERCMIWSIVKVMGG